MGTHNLHCSWDLGAQGSAVDVKNKGFARLFAGVLFHLFQTNLMIVGITPAKIHRLNMKVNGLEDPPGCIWVVATRICFMFIPKIGEMIQFDLRIFFQMGWWKTTN